MSPLGAELARRLEREGPIPVAEFMRACLQDSRHGYYRTQTAIGSGGDFITAPEISQTFGELLGLWAAEIWSAMGRPRPVHLVELGPGRGTLMRDALRAIAKVAAEFRAALELHLVEISFALRARQKVALADASPRWHERLESVPEGPAVVFANEFFDALPVRQLVAAGAGWRERMVAADGGRLVFTAGAPVASSGLPPAADGAILEISEDREALARALGARLAARGGAALIVDYGAAASGIGDTLQAVRGHRKVDPLAEPGLADLTAHVDFQRLAAATRAAGAAAYGPVPQGQFLQRLGIAARAAALLHGAPEAQARDIAAAVGRLIDPGQMGTLFKVLALAAPSLPTPPGFDPAGA